MGKQLNNLVKGGKTMQAYAQKPIQHQTNNSRAAKNPTVEGQSCELDGSPYSESVFAYDFSQIPIQGQALFGIQAKLQVSEPGDRNEQEADRVAEQVMSIPEPQLRQPHARAGEWHKHHTQQPAHENLQLKSVEARDSENIAVPHIVHEVLHSSGQPLDSSTRKFMETRFGYNFSQVRLHTDACAAKAASSIGARAFTSIRNIVFGAGEYAPQTESGRKLLSHELTHVVQQGAGVRIRNTIVEHLLSPFLSPAIYSVHPTPIVQRKELANTPEVSEPTSQPMLEPDTIDQDVECTFQLNIAGINYCFVAKQIEKTNSQRYQLTAYALGGDVENSVRYTSEIWIDIKNDMRSSMLMTLKMTSTDKKSTLSVNPQSLTKAWNEQAPVGSSAWEFVVLEVYDESKQELPIRGVYWMGGDWEKLGSAHAVALQNKKVATFRIGLSKFPKDYFKNKTEGGFELLSQKKVNELIANQTPVRVSLGFDEGTYVGMKVKTSSKAIKDGSGSKIVPFDEAAGKQVADQTTYHVSQAILAPQEIQANFKISESAIPGGLEATSLEKFRNEIREVLLYMQDTAEADVEIRAYTDTAGTPEKNRILSQDRAESAKKYLTDVTIWDGAEGRPKALASDRIILAQGEGQKLAEEDLKKKHPKDWQQIIGTKAAADLGFRKFIFKYILR
jgi:hypothetical protein